MLYVSTHFLFLLFLFASLLPLVSIVAPFFNSRNYLVLAFQDFLADAWIPSKDWSIIIPIYILSLIPFTICLFLAWNLSNTPDWSELDLVVDCRGSVLDLAASTGDATERIARSFERMEREDLIPDLQDIPLAMVNRCWTSSY